MIPLQIGHCLVLAGLQSAAVVSAGLQPSAFLQLLVSTFEQAPAACKVTVFPQLPLEVESHLTFEAGGWIHISTGFGSNVPGRPLQVVAAPALLVLQVVLGLQEPSFPLPPPLPLGGQILVPETIE